MIEMCSDNIRPTIAMLEMMINWVAFLIAAIFLAPTLIFYVLGYLPMFVMTQVYLLFMVFELIDNFK